MERERISSIQVLRGIAALGVVVFHYKAIELKHSPDFTVINDFFRLGESGVDLFFVISGFIMALITFPNWEKVNNIQFIAKRSSRIFPVYWLYTLITLIVFLIFPGKVNTSQGGQFELLQNIFLLPSEHLPIVMVAWSLIYEFYFYIIFSLLIKLNKKYVYFALAIWFFILVIYNIVIPNSANYLVYFFTNPYSLEFILGIITYIVYARIKNIKYIKNYAYIGITVSIILAPIIYFKLTQVHLFSTLILGFNYSLLLLSLVILEKNQNIKFPTVFIAIGDSSYSIYLSHLLSANMMVFFVGQSFFSHSSAVFSLILLFIVLSFVLITSFISYTFFERITYNYLSKKIDNLFSKR